MAQMQKMQTAHQQYQQWQNQAGAGMAQGNLQGGMFSQPKKQEEEWGIDRIKAYLGLKP